VQVEAQLFLFVIIPDSLHVIYSHDYICSE